MDRASYEEFVRYLVKLQGSHTTWAQTLVAEEGNSPFFREIQVGDLLQHYNLARRYGTSSIKTHSKSLICATSHCFAHKLRAQSVLPWGVVSCCIILYWCTDMILAVFKYEKTSICMNKASHISGCPCVPLYRA